MRSPRFRGSVLFLAAALIAFGSASARAQISNGKATRVGDAPPAGAEGDSVVTLTARFPAPPDVDLSASTLALEQLLNEAAPGGAGELVHDTGGGALLPASLTARTGSRSGSALFLNAGSLRPNVRAAVKRRVDGTYQISLRVNRATIANGPALCTGTTATTDLTTAFTLQGGSPQPVHVSFTQPWLCQGERLRVAPPPPGPTPVPGIPLAEIRIDQITRETGQPNLVRLDGSRSSDSDGTIASYTFAVVDLANGATVFGPATGAAATADVTLSPGDYRATLTVTDNDGKSSAQASRGFTLH
ncbi:MAG TPA: PKD domain-containing protein [Candidatus Binatia bacterium]|nr:PKD domain-containing protein [Candidatus Binatia bacterium]